MVSISGIILTILAVTIPTAILSPILKTYIGVLVLAMGVILVSGLRFSFSWKKLGVVRALSSFSEGLSGGGFGPVIKGGQVVI